MTGTAKADEHYERQVKLAEIARRHEAIIPGPWRWYGNTQTDQVMLATTDRGRLYIMTLTTRETQYVFHHYFCESYDLSTISNTQVQQWCGGHDEHGGDDTDGCICEDIAYFLKGEIDPEEGARHFSHDRRPHSGTILTRGITIRPDLRFPVPIPAPDGVDADEQYRQHGGHMRSYRDHMPRYEVLGYRTVFEWEMDQGGVQNARHALYREDFTGLDNPNADFIQYAPEDVAFLLAEVRRLQVENEKLRPTVPAATLETELAQFVRGEREYLLRRFSTHEEGEAWRAQVRQAARACHIRGVRTGRADADPLLCWALVARDEDSR